jgi:capsular polysaccharide biosynthesis protein
MGNWLKEKVPATDNNSPKRIFIVRETDKVRKLINQNNIIELLTEYNFTPVKLEELTITEQINIFRNVTCVVGVQGAGLSNIIYMPKNSLIINLINKQHHDICFFNLANALDHRIIMQQCKTDGETNLHPQHYNMNADITELKNYLDTYLK